MPTYCYRRSDGSIVELTMSVAEMLRLGPNPVIDGRRLTRDIAAEHSATPRTSCDLWPMRSDAVGVHPLDAARAAEADARRGVPTDYCPTTGCAIFRDRAHRKAWLKAHGMIDRDGGYGD